MADAKRRFVLAWGAAGLLLLVVTPASRLWEARAWLDQIRLTEITLFVWMLPLLGLLVLERGLWMAPRVKWQLWLLLSLGCISALLSPFSVWPWVELATFTCLAGLCLVVFFVQQQDERVAAAIVMGMFVAVLLLLVTCAASLAMVFSAGMELIPSILVAGFDNPRWLAQFQAISLPVLAMVVASCSTRPKQAGAFLVLSLWWFVAIIQGSRGVCVSMGVTMLLFACFRQARWWSLLQLKAIIAGSVFWALLVLVLVPLFDIPVNFDLAGRLSFRSAGRVEIWLFAIERIGQNPLWGLGPMSFQASPVYGGHPHNALIQIAYEWGLPALLVLLGAGCTLAVMVWRRCDNRALWENVAHSHMVTVLMASLLSASIDAMVSGVIVMPYSQMWLAIVIGLLWFQLAPSVSAIAMGRADRVAKMVFGVLVLVSAIGLAVMAASQYEGLKTLDIRDKTVRESPRYWFQGSILLW